MGLTEMGLCGNGKYVTTQHQEYQHPDSSVYGVEWLHLFVWSFVISFSGAKIHKKSDTNGCVCVAFFSVCRKGLSKQEWSHLLKTASPSEKFMGCAGGDVADSVETSCLQSFR
jgi:hypothetical protein